MLIDHAKKVTSVQREFLKQNLDELGAIGSDVEIKKLEQRLRKETKLLRGKLDDASVVAYEVARDQPVNHRVWV